MLWTFHRRNWSVACAFANLQKKIICVTGSLSLYATMTCTVQWEINRTIELNVDPDGIHAPDVNRGGSKTERWTNAPTTTTGIADVAKAFCYFFFRQKKKNLPKTVVMATSTDNKTRRATGAIDIFRKNFGLSRTLTQSISWLDSIRRRQNVIHCLRRDHMVDPDTLVDRNGGNRTSGRWTKQNKIFESKRRRPPLREQKTGRLPHWSMVGELLSVCFTWWLNLLCCVRLFWNKQHTRQPQAANNNTHKSRAIWYRTGRCQRIPLQFISKTISLRL